MNNSASIFSFNFKTLHVLVTIALFSVLASCSKNDDEISTPTPTAFQIPATEDIVMYEINPNSFSASKNIQGIIGRLDNLKALGINTIWIMPIYPVGITNSFGSPYCVRNYKQVNPSLGTLEDLQSLVTQAHAKNMAVILDWVANHTSWDNVWMSTPSWYTHDANGVIISPAGTNWNDVADLDFSNTAMRLAMIDAMKYWVTVADVDGFRCDAADYVPFDFWQQALNSLQTTTGKNLIMLAEGSRADHFDAGFQMNFSWNFLSGLKSTFGSNQSVSNLFLASSNETALVPQGKRKLRFTTNHDESNIATPMTVFGGKNGALAASVLAIYMDGVPLLYTGQEVGVSSPTIYNGVASINWAANNDMLLEYTKLLTFYSSSNAAKKGTLQPFLDTDVAVFSKTVPTEKIAVFVNTRSSTKTVGIPAVLQGNWVNALTGESVVLSADKTLTSYQYLILKKVN